MVPPRLTQEARVFNSSVLDGKLRSAVQLLTSGERRGVLGPKDLCTKTCAPVIEVLRAKHPDQRIPDLQDPENLAFSEYPKVLDPIPIDCDPVAVESVANSSLEQQDAAELTRHSSRAASSAMVGPHQISGRSCWN